jgi:uncharacterized protein (TIGR02466 family)
MELYSLFPTPIVRIPANEKNYETVQLEIKSAIEKITKENDSSSLTYLYKGAPETSISNKTYDFIEKFQCDQLKNRIYEAITQYVDRIGWFGERNFIIKNSWINIIDQEVLHGQHCHPGYTVSGVYYYRISEKQGTIAFNNPNPLMFSCNFPQGVLCPQTVDIVPNDGDIILFPSWLVHSTRKNKSESVVNQKSVCAYW